MFLVAAAAIEQRAAKVGVPVDGRIARGRNVRHALRLITEVPNAARIVVAAAGGDRHDRFDVEDIDVLVVRHGPDAGEIKLGSPDTDPLLRAHPAA